MDDIQQPDEARPAKRVRLEAPLAITEEIQEEIIDDEEDWDDIYGNTMTPKKVSTPNVGASPDADGGLHLPLDTMEEEPLDPVEMDLKGPVEDGIQIKSTNDDNELVAHQQTAAATDDPLIGMLEETSQAETGPPHDVDISQREETDQNAEAQIHDDASRDQREQQRSANGPFEATDDDSVQVEAEDNDTTPQQPKPEQDPEFMAAAAVQKKNENAEWQFNSSDAESSSDSESDSSSDDSSDSDSGSDGGYELLDPATAAKILMSGDGDDDGDKSKNKAGDHQPRTANEVKEDVVPKPDVVVTEDMKITYLGNVDRTVETMVLIKAVTPGEFQVLESGSVLCNEQRKVIGAVAETLGRVQEPMYSVAFTNAKEIEDMGLEFGTKVFYVDSHSTFVFTQPLKNMKGTDASNIHDEEVGEDELEFSDDEKEAEYKRLKKLAKRGGRGGLSRSAFNEDRAIRDFDAPSHDSGHTFANGSDVPQQQYGGGMNYDDGDVQDEFYSPLKRPDNLSQLMAGGGPPPMLERGNFRGRGRGYDRGRGDRGRGRGDRGRGRGGFDHRNQRGGRGGQGQNDRGRGDFGQQNGHRGPAHSFPDRHNNDNRRGNADKHQFNRRGSNASHTSSPPPQQQYSTYQSQYQPQQPTPQNYQFNGYTFQYGNSPPPPPVPQPGYYDQQQMPAQSSAPSIPAGAYVNPAFFQNQQAQGQWPQPQQQPSYVAWPAQQYQQYAQPGAPQPPQPAPNNLADILRQLGGYQQQQR